jgi:hypothetical protein
VGDEGAMLHTPENHEELMFQDKFYCWYEYSIYPPKEFQQSPFVAT